MKDPKEKIETFLSRRKNFPKILSEKNDRAAAIMTSALIEDTMTFILQIYFEATSAAKKRGAASNRQLTKHLFEGFGPLSTFSGKILIFDALGLLSQSARQDLQNIKKVRNIFAHEAIFLNFSSPEIAPYCDDLTLWAAAEGILTGLSRESPRKIKFSLSGVVIMFELIQSSKQNTKLFQEISSNHKTSLQDFFGKFDEFM